MTDDQRPVRVVVADDDGLVRSALTLMLDGAEGIRVVGEAADGDQVVSVVDRNAPDVVLMDVRMPRVDGITATRRLRARPRPPQVVVLTTFDSDTAVLRALRAGAAGFVLKDTPPAQIVDAVRRAAEGEPTLSPAVLRRLMERMTDATRAQDRARSALAGLSPRERDVAVAVARGLPNADVAGELGMTVATVKAHVSSVLTKLDLDNRTQVALLVHDAGLA